MLTYLKRKWFFDVSVTRGNVIIVIGTKNGEIVLFLYYERTK